MVNRKNSKLSSYSGMEIEDYVLTATEKEATKMERGLDKRGLTFLWVAMLCLLATLAGRVFFLTVVSGGYYQEISRGNSIRSIVIKAPRGRIFDRVGTALVNNTPSIDVVALPIELPRDPAKLTAIAQTLAAILKLDQGQLETTLTESQKNKLLGANAVLLKENVSQEESLNILEKSNVLLGISIEKTAIRQYVNAQIFSHILGYEGKIQQSELDRHKGYLLTDYIGKQGLEKAYESNLRGVDGANQIEVDSMGSAKREIGIVNPIAGSDLVLNLDAQLQQKFFESIEAVLEKTGAKTASAVAIDPRTGAVLALVNVPSYDSNLFARRISPEDYANFLNDPSKPLFNRAIAGEYPPGSTIKPAIALGALSEKNITPETIIDGLGGSLRVGGFSFGDWKVHGPSDVRTAIAQSNDIFFYTIGGGYGNIKGLGMDLMKKYYNLFGFGEHTGIDLGGEADGFIPDEKWKLDTLGEKWYIGNSYHASIGQGYVLSLIHI